MDAVATNQIDYQPMGGDTTLDITRLTREPRDGEAASKDDDFSRTSLLQHIDAGYAMARRTLADPPHASCYHPLPPGRQADV